MILNDFITVKNIKWFKTDEWCIISIIPLTIHVKAEDGTEVPKQSTVQTISEEDEMNADGLTLDRPMTSLEKLHIIVGYAIVRRDLRLLII